MDEEIEHMLMEENDSTEGMGAILWIAASIAVTVVTACIIICWSK